jgi:hypothetical protein
MAMVTQKMTKMTIEVYLSFTISVYSPCRVALISQISRFIASISETSKCGASKYHCRLIEDCSLFEPVSLAGGPAIKSNLEKEDPLVINKMMT